MHGGFPPKSTTLRLYAEQKKGVQGRVDVKATVHPEDGDKLLTEYLKQKESNEKARKEEDPLWTEKPLSDTHHQ